MKSFISLYGKAVIFVIVAVGLIAFALGNQSGSMRGLLKVVTPVATVKDDNSTPLLVEVSSRANPILEITPKKLEVGVSYNLESSSVVGIVSKNASGTVLPVKVIKIINPQGMNVTKSMTGTSFKASAPGRWMITYQNKETFKGVEKTTTKSYYFVVDM